MQFGIHFGKAKGHSKAMVNFTKNIFVTFKRFIPKQFFSLKINFSESIHGLRTASTNRSKTYAALCMVNICILYIWYHIGKGYPAPVNFVSLWRLPFIITSGEPNLINRFIACNSINVLPHCNDSSFAWFQVHSVILLVFSSFWTPFFCHQTANNIPPVFHIVNHRNLCLS